jgi:hypothetical protein
MHARFLPELTSQVIEQQRSFVGKPQGMSPFPLAVAAYNRTHKGKFGRLEEKSEAQYFGNHCWSRIV